MLALLMTCAPGRYAAGQCDPEAGFTLDQNSCIIVFAPGIGGDCTEHEWDFGDATSLTTVESPRHLYKSAGSYNVTHRLTTADDVFTCVQNIQITACLDECAGSPANFSYTLMPGNGGCMADFLASSPVGIITHFWDFGDAPPTNTSTDANPMHTYWLPGAYTVTHTVTTKEGTFTCTQTVNAGQCNWACDENVAGITYLPHAGDPCTIDLFADHISDNCPANSVAPCYCQGNPSPCNMAWVIDDISTPGIEQVITGSPKVIGAQLTSGDQYLISFSVWIPAGVEPAFPNGGDFTCVLDTICTDTMPPQCSFSSGFDVECSKLMVSLSADCDETGNQHNWDIAIAGIPAGELSNHVFPYPIPSGPNVEFQVTNFNTDQQVTVSYTFTPPGGTPVATSQIIDFTSGPNPVDGIFILNSDVSDVFPGQNSLTGENLFVEEELRIDVPSFTFTSTHFYMADDSRLKVMDDFDLTLEKGVVLEPWEDCPCMWRGIELRNKSRIVSDGSTIRLAYYGLRTLNGGGISADLNANEFVDNYIGIRSRFDLIFENFSNNQFHTIKGLPDCCPSVTDFEGTCFSTETSTAGISVSGLDGFLVPADGGNEFRDLAFGIDVNDCNATVLGGCTFTNIKSHGITCPCNSGVVREGGMGIRFTNGTDRSLREQSCTFSNCTRGIFANPGAGNFSNVVCDGNNMDFVQIGCDLVGMQGNFDDVSIQNNRIWASYLADPILSQNEIYGVQILDLLETASTFRIENNTDITVTLNPANGWARGIYLHGANFNTFPNDPTLGVDAQITGNTITVNTGLRGIHVENISSANLSGNTVNILSSPLIFGQTADGVLIEGGTMHTLCNNTIAHSGSDMDTRGIRTVNSLDNVYSTNIVTDGEHGIEFDMDCGTASVICSNDMNGTQDVGLFYDGAAVTGDQPIDGLSGPTHGNTWTGTYADIGARNLNNGQINMSEFFVPENISDQNPSHFPLAWFINSEQPNGCEATCETGNDQIAGPTPNPVDLMIADGTATHSSAALMWSLEQNLYRKLKNNPGYQQLNSSFTGFVNTKQGTVMDDLNEIREGISQLFAVPSAIATALKNNQDTIASALSQLETLPSGNLTQREQLLQQIEVLTLDNNCIRQGLESARLANADALIAQNAAIGTTAVYQRNEKDVYDIYLRSAAKGLQPDGVQLLALKSVAEQCWEDGGPAVVWARGLYGINAHEFLPEYDCESGFASLGNGNKLTVSVSTVSFAVFPNPADGHLTVQALRPVDSKTEVGLYDLFGKQVFVDELPEGEISLSWDVSALSSGIYFVKVSSNEDGIFVEKIIINK
ncbi:MAG TPA: T9SS type A sorting domain-containing protein [Bacteroidetes bacterium]|nr:T9SS type A sorting domain-containing protein [Bacteroidota bacterium]